jgi:hypothetical protein
LNLRDAVSIVPFCLYLAVFPEAAEPAPLLDALFQDHVLLAADNAASATKVRDCWADSPVCTLFDAAHLPGRAFPDGDPMMSVDW